VKSQERGQERFGDEDEETTSGDILRVQGWSLIIGRQITNRERKKGQKGRRLSFVGTQIRHLRNNVRQLFSRCSKRAAQGNSSINKCSHLLLGRRQAGASGQGGRGGATVERTHVI
jgi:hypothetical protein